MSRKPFWILIIVIYIAGYIWFRQTNIATWEFTEEEYIIFPEDKLAYYVFRPLTYLDAALTDMQFHIGSHEEP